jgi:hypothetical protein
MSTPAEHATAAEAFITRIDDTTRVSPDDTAVTVAQAHAHLAGAAGTGDHYKTADELLANAAAMRYSDGARKALLHAILADRAAPED